MNEDISKLKPVGSFTEEERELTHFLLIGIGQYISDKPTDRRVLIAALSHLCQIVFLRQTPFNLKSQCAEIDAFCDFLKEQALTGAINE